MKNRILSLLLILALLLPLGNGFAVTADTETSYHYNFMRLRYGEWSNLGYHPHQMTNWGWEDVTQNYLNYTTDPFIYFGASTGASWTWVSSSSNLPEFGPYFIGTAGEWVGYTVRVGSSGFFIPTITYAGVTNGGVFDVYLAPLGAADPLGEAYYVGQMNTKTDALAYQQIAALATVALPAGDYSFCMKVADGQTSAVQWVSALRLTPTAGNWLDINADAVSLEQEETKSVLLTLPDGVSALTDCTVTVSDPKVAQVTLSGSTLTVTALSSGTAKVHILAKAGEQVGGIVIPITVAGAVEIPEENTASKTRTTYMTDGKRAAAQDNIKHHVWAQEQANTTIIAANNYTDDWDWAWNLITSQDLPRACNTAARWDPEIYNCFYCNENLTAVTGNFYPWKYDVENYPWKLQCPNCFRRFPTNDFSKFYEAGINEHGFFDYEYALQNGSQYLTNDFYPEKGEGWGVDDGYGYVTNETYTQLLGYGTAYRRHTYIAYYNHWALWYGGTIRNILGTLGNAYAYTGDLKYGRVGAIMMDRIADVYPDMYVSEYFPTMSNSDFNTARGRIIGGIWETGLARDLCMYYDYFFPAFDDPEVVEFLSDKAETYRLGDARGAHGTANESRGGVGNDKSTPAKIRQNIENGLLREVISGVREENQIYGNSGMHQSTATMAAVVLDSAPETANTLAWVMGSGGNVTSNILSAINRDGQGNEAAPGYSDTWVSSYAGIVDALDSYDGYSGANLYENVKFIKLMKTNFPLTLARNGTAPIGDSGGYANNLFNLSTSRLVTAFLRTGDVEIAQYLYFLNGNKADGIQGNIFTPAADVADDIQAIIDTYGEYPFDESSAMTGSFGFYALRDGTKTETENTQRDFWMYFGRTTNHGHPAVLNIGMDAYGTPVLSDFGYPESTSGTPRTLNWDRSTIIHNTVQVNDTKQSTVTQGTALHFDGDNDGRVQVMDARNTAAYSAASEFRRTLVMVDVDSEISYGVDFFRVLGGNAHTFALHPVSVSDPTAENLTFTKQTSGTYAGSNIAYGNYSQASGYDGFYNVSHATPTGPYSLDYKISNFRALGDTSRDLHLKITQLNDFTPTTVSIASCEPAKNYDNPDSTRSLLVDRHGTNLDSLFTTVLQPYDTTPYIAKSEVVSMTRTGGASEASTDKAYAVKVTLTDGREDYIVYATNNAVCYLVDGWLEFQGFVGVVSREDGQITYSHLTDGTRIGERSATAAYSGTVKDFTKTLSFCNTITVTPSAPMDTEDLIGRYIFIRNNAHSYQIQGAAENADGTVTLDVGDYSFVNGAGYTYDISVGDAFTIPLSKSWNTPAVGLSTVSGAQIRTTGNQGLRFISTIDKTRLGFSRVVEYGTVLIPAADLTDITELQIGATLNGHAAAKVPAVNLYEETDTAITFTAVITDIAEKNYARSYTARAYAILDDGSVVYAESGAARSVYEVAKKALENPSESDANKAIFQAIVETVEG